MKKYYIDFGVEKFGNRYSLFYTSSNESVPETAERITRKEAIAYARAERRRRVEDVQFSGYADIYIFPLGYRFNPAIHPSEVCDSSGVIVIA